MKSRSIKYEDEIDEIGTFLTVKIFLLCKIPFTALYELFTEMLNTVYQRGTTRCNNPMNPFIRELTAETVICHGQKQKYFNKK